MSELSTLPKADTSDMVRVHRVFRDAVNSPPTLVAPVAVHDVHRAEYVGTYYDNVLRLLHAHHEGEDEALTPVLVERASPAEAAEAQRVGGQHGAVLGELTLAETRVAEWRSDPSAEANAAVIDTFARLSDGLTSHLDEEETVVLPIAGKYMNVADWGRLPEHTLKNFTGDKLWLVLGLVREQMTPQQILDMDAHLPRPLLQFWVSTGQRMFTDYMIGLRARSNPVG